MTLSSVLLAVAIVCALTAVVAAVLITAALERRGIDTPYLLIGPYIFRNLARYRDVTRKETGHVGALFYLYVLPINAALVLALLGLLVRQFGA
jgi:hypothetical protein